jgi:hypothetical protein
MTVRFVTQAAYKDRRRDDLRETLTSRSATAPDPHYEMSSGGEASGSLSSAWPYPEVLPNGPRACRPVIDEGFGSQDTQADSV